MPSEFPFQLTFTFLLGDVDKGAFYGFKESSADIRYFVLTDDYIATKNLRSEQFPNLVRCCLARICWG
jgi:hypothetical protein